MATILSAYFRQRRLQLGLRPGDVARYMGYTSVVGAANKIVMFEEKGDIHPELFEKLKTALEIDEAMVERLIQEDQRAFLKAWWAWASQPVPWVVSRRDVPTFVPPWPVPEQITTQQDAEVWARRFAAEHHAPVVLHLSRRITVSFDREGQVTNRHEASPGEVLLPYLHLKGDWKFRFVSGPTGISMESAEFPKQRGPQP